MTKSEVCERLKISPYTFYIIVRHDKLTGTRHQSGKWHISENDFKMFERKNPKLGEAPTNSEELSKWIDSI